MLASLFFVKYLPTGYIPVLNGNVGSSGQLKAPVPVHVYSVESPLGPEFHSPPPPFPRFFREFLLKGNAPLRRIFHWQTVSPEEFFAQKLGSLVAGSVIIIMDFVLLEGGWAGESKPFDQTPVVRLQRLWALLNHSEPLIVVLHSDGSCMFDQTPGVWAGTHHVLYRNTWSTSLHDEWHRSRLWEEGGSNPNSRIQRRPWLRDIPFGTSFSGGLAVLEANKMNFGSRSLLFSFRGSLSFRKPSRRLLVLATAKLASNLGVLSERVMRDAPPHPKLTKRYLVDTKNSDLGSRYATADNLGYLELLHESLFILCPPGDVWESYRIWEAVAAGSFPVIVDNTTLHGCDRPAAHLMATVPGMLAVQSWDNLPSVLEAATRNMTTLFQKQRELVAWWEQYQTHVLEELLSTVSIMRTGRWTDKPSKCNAIPLSPRGVMAQQRALALYWRHPQPYNDTPWSAGPFMAFGSSLAKPFMGACGFCRDTADPDFSEVCRIPACTPPAVAAFNCNLQWAAR